MRKKTKVFFGFVAAICAFFIGAGIGGVKSGVTSASASSEKELVENYYQRVTMQKDGTGTGENSKTFGGLVPYGSGKIELGTYDMSNCLGVGATPLFTIIPHKEWKSAGSSLTGTDDMFFNVNLQIGSKSITYRFAKQGRTDGYNIPCVYIGNTGGTYGAQGNWVKDDPIYPHTILPYNYDGTKPATAAVDDTKTQITSPTDIGFYYGTNGYWHMDVGHPTSGASAETATGSGVYRLYISCVYWNQPKAEDWKNVSVSIEFDKETVAKNEAWVMFTSIAGNDFAYDINYEAWGGTINDSNYVKGYVASDTEIPALPTNVIKDNYTFSHWYYGSDSNNRVNDAGFADWLGSQTGDITFKAYYIPTDYQVNYNLNYTGAPSVQADTLNYINYETFALKELSIETYPAGMVFDGWYTQASGGTKVTSLSVLGNTELYAHWTAGYIVTFDCGESQVKVPVKAGESVVAITAENKVGYTFNAWKLSGVTYDFSSAVNADITLVADYSLNTYLVAFYIDGVKTAENTMTYNQAITTLPNIPEKAGHNAGTWYCGETVVTAETTVTEDMNIVAVYEKKTFTVRFDTAGANAVEEITVPYGERIDGDKINVFKAGCAFVEWQFNGTKFDFVNGVTQDMELTAVWKIRTYQVRVMKNGEEIAVITKNHGDTLSIDDVESATDEKNIATLYANSDLSTEFDSQSGITASTTVYLKNTEKNVNVLKIVVYAGSGVVIALGAVAFVLIVRKKGE